MTLHELIQQCEKDLNLVVAAYDDGQDIAAADQLGDLSALIQNELEDATPEQPAPAKSTRPSTRQNQTDSPSSAEASESLPPGEAKVDKSGCAGDAPIPEPESNKETV